MGMASLNDNFLYFSFLPKLFLPILSPFVLMFSWETIGFLYLVMTCLQNTALNEALKKEVERLKVATGEMMTPTDTYNLGMQPIPYNQSLFYPHHPQTGPGDTQIIQLPEFHPFQPNMSTPHQPMLATANSHTFSEMLQQDPLGRLQGLDINGRNSHLVKSEGPSISASESSSTFWCKCCRFLVPTCLLNCS